MKNIILIAIVLLSLTACGDTAGTPRPQAGIDLINDVGMNAVDIQPMYEAAAAQANPCGQGAPPPAISNIVIAHACLNNTIGVNCNTPPEEDKPSMQEGVMYDAIFNGGAVDMANSAYYTFEITNHSSETLDGHILVPMVVSGCGYMGRLTQPVVLSPGQSLTIEDWGNLLCVNAVAGPQTNIIALFRTSEPIPGSRGWNDPFGTLEKVFKIRFNWDYY